MPDAETEVSERHRNMETHPQARKMQLIWIFMSIWLAAGATDAENSVSEEPRHRSKRTMTTICVEIRPSGPHDEPYYMCRGANFGAESGQQGCVEVKNQGGQEPVYMCQGMEPPKSVAGDENRPAPYQPVPQPEFVHTFPSFPAFGGGSSQPQPQFAENPLYQFPTPPTAPSPPPPYQEQSSYPQPLSQQSQAPALGQSGFYGRPPVAAHSSAPAAHSHGLPPVPYPTLGSPPAAPPGVPNGPGPTAASPPYDPAADQGSPNRPSKEYGIVGSSRHRPGLDDNVVGVPNVGFRPEELNQQYRRPVSQPQDQMMWVPITHSSDPENDPVMRAFYSSLTGAGSQSQEATVPADTRRELAPMEPTVGQGAPNYTPYNSQYPGLLPSPTPVYDSPSSVPNCNGCTAPLAPLQCQTPADNGMSYSTSCPSFQPVIISMPCYGQQQPTPYYSVPRTVPGLLQRAPPTLGAPFGLTPAPVASPFGGAFGTGGQMAGTPFGMSQGFGMDQHVGGPFGMGMQLGMGLSPFGPFGTLNPFNPFNRILGATPQTPPAPSGNFFQRVFNFNPNEFVFPTTEAAPAAETSTTESSGKLNFASSTPATINTPAPPSTPKPSGSLTPSSTEMGDTLGDALDDEVDDDDADGDSHPDEDLDDDVLATTAPEGLDKKQQPEITASQFVSKATDLLKTGKRKRQHTRSSRRVSQKHRYLQQL